LLQEFAIDYAQVKHQNAEGDGRIGDLFGGAEFERRTFPNQQIFDFDGLKGRTLSSSYLPAADHPRHATMMEALRRLFDRHATGGGGALWDEKRADFGGQLGGGLGLVAGGGELPRRRARGLRGVPSPPT